MDTNKMDKHSEKHDHHQPNIKPKSKRVLHSWN